MSRTKADLLKNRQSLDRSAGRVTLFGTDSDHEYLILDLDRVHPNPAQPRTFFDEEALQELASSIAQHGVLQPILVRETQIDRFEIIAGERRWRASRLAGKSQIPALVFKTDNVAVLAALENLQREDLDALDTAQALAVLINTYNATHEELGKILGKSQTWVSRTLSVLSLPDRIRAEYHAHRRVPITMLAEIAALPDEAAQLALWEQAKGGMSVAAARKAKKGTAENSSGSRFAKITNSMSKEIASLRANGSTLEEQHKERLRRLRDEIDAVLGD